MGGRCTSCGDIGGQWWRRSNANEGSIYVVNDSAAVEIDGNGCDRIQIAWYRLIDLVRATITSDDRGTMWDGLNAASDTFMGAILEFNDRYQEKTPGG